MRFNNVSPAIAGEHAKDLEALNLVVIPLLGLLPRALEIGLKYKLAAYDSAYIALAEHLGYPLITDDSNQAKAATAEGITLKPVTDFV